MFSWEQAKVRHKGSQPQAESEHTRLIHHKIKHSGEEIGGDSE
jgi:hypothetical protein